MNRRYFLSLFTVSALMLSTAAHTATPMTFEEGAHYKLLPESARAMVPKGTVQEFFFYGCSHCMDMEKPLHEWLSTNPKSIHFEQIPAVFQNPSWPFLARAHYALKQSQQLELAHQSLFQLFIIDRARPKNEQDIAKLLTDKHPTFNSERFVQQFAHDDTNVAVNRAAKLSGQYQLEAVPTFIINGKYSTDLTMAGSHANLFIMIEQLANK
jgi:thiol:disulfide interchange protein DsbA